jgi:quinolinate synthase
VNKPGLVAEITRLKKRANAVVLCHNYQSPAIYDVADFIGDSLELARKAAQTSSPFIVFAGVRFMAETAKLLNPGSRVVLAEPRAGCRMADMITAAALRARREELGNVLVVAYVNTPADVKAESDVCCTSANAVKVVNSLPKDRRILFVPDRNLALYVARETGRDVIPWEGFCYVHAVFTAEDVRRARSEHPHSVVVVHPECTLSVIDAADFCASTGGMYRMAKERRSMVLGTEAGMCARIMRDYPDNHCFPLRRTALCRNMKMTTLGKVNEALSGKVEEVAVPPAVADRARAAIERMLG